MSTMQKSMQPSPDGGQICQFPNYGPRKSSRSLDAIRTPSPPLARVGLHSLCLAPLAIWLNVWAWTLTQALMWQSSLSRRARLTCKPCDPSGGGIDFRLNSIGSPQRLTTEEPEISCATRPNVSKHAYGPILRLVHSDTRLRRLPTSNGSNETGN